MKARIPIALLQISLCAFLVLVALLAMAGCGQPAAVGDDVLVFSFFRESGSTGLFLASSEDGLRWEPLNNDQSLLVPEVGESKLMRDPSITRGPDGRFHLVWTTSWDGRTIGYSHSDDLRNWAPQRAIPLFDETDNVMNCWAPEIFYDEASGEFVVVWASTIEGRFPETVETGERGRNHRQYAFRTRDFQDISPVELFYDPGFLVIDAALFEPLPRTEGPRRYGMVVKNETRFPPAKNLFLTFAPTLRGPWREPSAPFSGDEWAEGPSIIHVDGYWYLYFDQYRTNRYITLRSQDLATWEDVTDQSRFPEKTKHGTAFRAPRAIVDALR
jgi:hypothetical protein